MDNMDLTYSGSTYDSNRGTNIESGYVILDPAISIKNKINNMINSLYNLFYN